ncbi:MAG: DNA polymerase III subunit delta', partial [Pseudomonadota bacterium]
MSVRDTPPPEADRLDPAPHPRHTAQVFGHEAVEQVFLAAHTAGRLHHAWLLTGPKGIGKATLAWRLARFLLATPPAEGGLFGAPEPPGSADIAPDHAVARRMAALSEPRLCLVRRPFVAQTGRLATQIPIDEVRRLKSFFQMSAAD